MKRLKWVCKHDASFLFSCLPNCTCMGLLQDCTGKMSCNVSLNATIPAFYRNNTFLPMRVLDVSTNSYWFHTFEWKQSILFGFLEQLNISSCEITDLPDNFFLYLGSLKILDLSYNVLRHLQTGLFKYLTELELLLLNGNSAILDIDSEVFGGSCSLPNLKMEYLHIGKISSKAFSGLKLKTLQFSYAVIDYIEENAFSELSVNEVYLNATKVISSSDLLFEGIRNVTHMKTYSYRFCCLLPSYLSKTTCIPKPESTTRCHDLLGQEKYMLWIAAIVSSFTNILSFRRHFAFDRTNHRFGHYFFLSNLAVSDFLMSVYDILITGADISFSGVYASVRDDWLKGTWCSFAAVISLCSVIASSLFVCLIAVGRFLVIRFPSGEMHFTRKLSLCIICLIWLFAAGVSTIPSLFSTTTKTDGVCFGLDYDHEPSIEMIFASCVLMCAALTIFVLTIMGSWNIEIERKATKANLIRARQMRKTDLRTSRNILVLAAIDAVCLLVTALLRELLLLLC